MSKMDLDEVEKLEVLSCEVADDLRREANHLRGEVEKAERNRRKSDGRLARILKILVEKQVAK